MPRLVASALGILLFLLGAWFMAAPDVLGVGPAAHLTWRVGGPIVAAIGLVAAWPAAYRLRPLAALVGLAFLVEPWFLGGAGFAGTLNAELGGLYVLALAIAPAPRTARAR